MRNEDSSLHTKSTVMSLKVKSGTSLLIDTQELCLVTDGANKVVRRRAPSDVKNLLKQLAIPELSVKLSSSSLISCTVALVFLGMSFLIADHNLDESWAFSVSIVL